MAAYRLGFGPYWRQAFIAAWTMGEPTSIRLPGPLIVMLKPSPLVLNFGSGKFGTPCERTHWANLRASCSACWTCCDEGCCPAGSSDRQAFCAAW